ENQFKYEFFKSYLNKNKDKYKKYNKQKNLNSKSNEINNNNNNLNCFNIDNDNIDIEKLENDLKEPIKTEFQQKLNDILFNWCKDNFIKYRMLLKAKQIKEQLTEILLTIFDKKKLFKTHEKPIKQIRKVIAKVLYMQ